MNKFSILCDIIWAWFIALACLGIMYIGHEFGTAYGYGAFAVSVALIYEVVREA